MQTTHKGFPFEYNDTKILHSCLISKLHKEASPIYPTITSTMATRMHLLPFPVLQLFLTLPAKDSEIIRTFASHILFCILTYGTEQSETEIHTRSRIEKIPQSRRSIPCRRPKACWGLAGALPLPAIGSYNRMVASPSSPSSRRGGLREHRRTGPCKPATHPPTSIGRIPPTGRRA